MRKLLIILLLTPFLSGAQPWIKEYPMSEWDYEVPAIFMNDYDKGYILSLVVINFTSTIQLTTLLKVDDNGEKLYNIKLGSSIYQSAICFYPGLTIDNGLIMGGATLDQNDGENPMLILLDSCRQKVWCATSNNNPARPDFFYNAVGLSDKSIVALSIQNDVNSLKPIFIHKFTKEGNQVWRKELASLDLHPLLWNPLPEKLLLLSDSSYLVTGTCYYPNPDAQNYNYVRMFMVKADADGNEQWLYVHGINDYIYSVGFTSVEYNGSIYSDGYQYNTDLPHFFKVGFNGELLYDTPIFVPDYNNRVARSYSLLSENINGYFFPAIKMFPLDISSADERPAVAKIDTMGIVHDFFMYDTIPALKFIGLPRKTKDNKIIVAGQKFSSTPNDDEVFGSRLLTNDLTLDSIQWTNYNYDSLCPGIVDHTIPIDNCFVIVNNTYHQAPVRTNLKMNAFPLPAGNEVTISYENSFLFRNIVIKCYDITGSEIKTIHLNSGINESRINTSTWPAGLYIAMAYSNEIILGSCKIVISR